MPVDSSLAARLKADVELSASDGTKLSLMLARGQDSQGNPLPKSWQLSEVPAPLNVRVSEEGAGLVDLPPELEAVVFRDNHIDGIGHILTTNGVNDYFSGVAYAGIDGYITKPPSVDEITLPTSEGDVRCWAEFDSAVYVSDGQYLHRSTDGTNFTQVLDVGAGNVVTDVVAFGAGDGDTGIVVGVENSSGVSQLARFSTDGTNFTTYTADDIREFSFFFVKDETLYGLDQPNVFRTTTDPFSATATWSGATSVGDELGKFQGGFVVSNVLVIFKTDRVFTVDADGIVKTLIAQFAETPDARNFEHFVAAHNSNMYFTVDEEVWEYDPVSGNVRPMGVPLLPDTLLDPGTAHQDGLAYDGVGIYCTHHAKMPYESSGGTTILRMTQDSSGNPTFERWLSTTSSGYRPQGPMHVSRAFTSRKTGRALYFNTTTPGKVGVLNIFSAPNPTEDSDSEFSTVAGHLVTGNITHNFPGQPKDYLELALDAKGLSATSTIDVFFYLNNDFTTRHTLVTGLCTDGLYALTFPFPTTGRSIMLDFVLNTSSVSDTPQILSWTLRAAVKFRLREIITLTARVADNLIGRGGAKLPHTAAEIRNIIRELRAKEGISIKYEDYRGYTFPNVRILPGFTEVDVADESAVHDETALNFRVMRVE